MANRNEEHRRHMELTTLFWVRDNLTLNVIMLIHPIDAIKAWQFAGRSAVGW